MTTEKTELNPFLIVRPITEVTSESVPTGYRTTVHVCDNVKDWPDCNIDCVEYTATVDATLTTQYVVRVNDKMMWHFSGNQGNTKEVSWFIAATRSLANERESRRFESHQAEEVEAKAVCGRTFAGAAHYGA